MTNEEIKEIFIRNGFKIHEGMTDLKPYVYAAAQELLEKEKLKRNLKTLEDIQAYLDNQDNISFYSEVTEDKRLFWALEIAAKYIESIPTKSESQENALIEAARLIRFLKS